MKNKHCVFKGKSSSRKADLHWFNTQKAGKWGTQMPSCNSDGRMEWDLYVLDLFLLFFIEGSIHRTDDGCI